MTIGSGVPPFSPYGQGDQYLNWRQILLDSGYDVDVYPFPGLPGPAFNPLAFGAVGDNSANDYAALQECINEAALNGAPVILGKKFKSSQQLEIPSNTTILGLGWHTGIRFDWTLAAGQGGSTYFINEDTTNGNTNIVFRGFQIEGVYDNTPYAASPSRVAGILFRRGSDIQVLGCRFYRVMAIALAYQGVSRATFAHNQIYQCGRDGITGGPFDTSPCTDIAINGNVIYEVADDGIAINASVDSGNPGTTRPGRIAVTGNTIFGRDANVANLAGRGILIRGAEDVTVAGNSITDTYSNGIFVDGDDGASGFLARRIAISGNTLRRCGMAGDGTQGEIGISLQGVSEFTVTGNTVTESKDQGIKVSDNGDTDKVVTAGLIANNVVASNGGASSNVEYGIYITAGVAGGVADVTVRNNTCYNNNGAGISMQGPTRCIVENNLCYNNGNASSGGTDVNAAGIRLSGLAGPGSTDMVVRGNRCYDTRGGSAKQNYGIVFATVTAIVDAIVEDNWLAGNLTASLQINQSPTTLVRRNNRLSSGDVSGRAVLVNGTVTVNTAEVVATDNIALTRVVGTGTTRGVLSVGTITAGTSFVINSTDLAGTLSADDDSTIFWEIVH